MEDKQMKRCTIQPVNWELQIKDHSNISLLNTKIRKLKRLTIMSIVEDVEQLEFSSYILAGENIKCTLWKAVHQFLKNLLTYPSITQPFTPRHLLKGEKTTTTTCIPMLPICN